VAVQTKGGGEMDVDAFMTLLEPRSKCERWDLIDGVAVMMDRGNQIMSAEARLEDAAGEFLAHGTSTIVRGSSVCAVDCGRFDETGTYLRAILA
jgi:hypothetical protein